MVEAEVAGIGAAKIADEIIDADEGNPLPTIAEQPPTSSTNDFVLPVEQLVLEVDPVVAEVVNVNNEPSSVVEVGPLSAAVTNELKSSEEQFVVGAAPVDAEALTVAEENEVPEEIKPLQSLADEAILTGSNKVDMIGVQEPALVSDKEKVPMTEPVPLATAVVAGTANEATPLDINAESLNGSESEGGDLLVKQTDPLSESVATVQEVPKTAEKVVEIGVDPEPVIADRSLLSGTNEMARQVTQPVPPLEETAETMSAPDVKVPVTPQPKQKPVVVVDAFTRITTPLGEVLVPNEKSVMHQWIAASHNLQVKGYVSFGDEVVILCPDGTMLRKGEDWNVTNAGYRYRFRIEKILKDRVSIRANGRESIES